MCVGRRGINAVELRDLIPQAGDREAAGALVIREVSLIAPADIVGGGTEAPVTCRRFVRVSRIGKEHAVSDVLIALKASRVAINVGQAGTKLKLVPRLVEQAVRCLGGSRSRSLRGGGRCSGRLPGGTRGGGWRLRLILGARRWPCRRAG